VRALPRVSGLAVLLVLVAVTTSGGQAWVIARVNFYIGEVGYQKAGSEEWTGCALRQAIYSGDAVRTGTESRLELKLDDEDIIRIDEDSELEVTRETLEAFQGMASKAKLTRGRLWTNVRKVVADREQLTVETPTVVAAIRGTVFRMDIPAATSTVMLVYEGQVEARENPPAPAGAAAVGPPAEVPPPAEITAQEWVQLVAANQQLTFTRGQAPVVAAFDTTADAGLEWVQWNRQRDATVLPPGGDRLDPQPGTTKQDPRSRRDES
jgi:hypothetical protein